METLAPTRKKSASLRRARIVGTGEWYLALDTLQFFARTLSTHTNMDDTFSSDCRFNRRCHLAQEGQMRRKQADVQFLPASRTGVLRVHRCQRSRERTPSEAKARVARPSRLRATAAERGTAQARATTEVCFVWLAISSATHARIIIGIIIGTGEVQIDHDPGRGRSLSTAEAGKPVKTI